MNLESSTRENPDVFTGILNIQDQAIPYAHFIHNCPINLVFETALKSWNLELPKIVITIVSDNSSVNCWPEEKQEIFIKGLIKASNATSMWILTNGLNIGITKLIGEKYQADYQKRCAEICFKQKNVVKKTALIGVCRSSLLTCQEKLDDLEKFVEVENSGNKPEENKFDLNAFHTHFLVIRDKTPHKSVVHRFLLKLEDAFKGFHSTNTEVTDCYETISPVPILAVLVQGDLQSIHYVLSHLRRKLPLLIIGGSGGLADVLAYTYYEVRRSFQKIKDTEYVENILKENLSNKITSVFPSLKDNKIAHNSLCTRILDCIEPPELKYITVFDIEGLTSHEDLPRYLLETIFKIRKTDVSNYADHLKIDLQLTIDWNCPELASTQVFYKDPNFKVDHNMFEQTLLRDDREEFISMFLENDFQVHRYLNSTRLIRLFEHVLKEEFFHEVCWVKLLGYRKFTRLDGYFIDWDLNWIVESLIGIPIYISSFQMNECARGIYNTHYSKTAEEAERKSLIVLIIWCLVSNRGKLAIHLWKHIDQPVMMALVCCVILDRLHVYIRDSKQQEEFKALNEQFAKMALNVFDLVYNDMPSKAYDSLSVKIQEWGNHSVVDMAALSQNKGFVAHPCCQKWLTKTFMDKIKLRDLTWGLFSVPKYIKVVLCAFLIFPMYFWVRFKETSEHEFLDTDENEIQSPYFGASEWQENKKNATQKERDRMRLMRYGYPPLWKMIYWMWSAPITKFWVSHIFYILYLIVFSLAVIWPSCGNTTLDLAVCIWTSLIAFDSMHRLYALQKITIDFINFMKLSALIIIANAIAMQAILYPDYPLDFEMFRKSFHKAFISFFVTPVEELRGTEQHCSLLEPSSESVETCLASNYPDSKCSTGLNFPSYLIVFQYMVLLKLILLPVLFALFSNTGNKVEAESDTLWKFQRYNLVTKFSVSLRLPPPLNIFSLIGMLCECIFMIFRNTCHFGYKKLEKEKSRCHQESFPSYESSYWRQFAKEYWEKQEYENHVKEYGEKEMEIISSLVDDVNGNEEIIYRIRSQIAQLEADINYTHAHLETLKYREKKEDKLNRPFTLHSLSRDSPYPKTKVQRFPVPDKYVPWEVMWLHYEPAIYTQPKSEFPNSLQPYVDDDISCSINEEENDQSNLPNYLWNMESVDSSGVYRNRKSWITDRKGKPLTYKLDIYGLPRNPMGRTGLRGKGALPRWGPNHNIFIVITRWQKRTSKVSEQSILGTPDLLEFVETWYMNKKDISLPGGFAGSESRYARIQTLFKEDENDPETWESSTDMIRFFQRYATDSDEVEVNEEHVKCEKNYCGYMDDQLNTDQAWKEVELWHVHYKITTSLSRMFKPDVKWAVLTEDVFIRLKDGQTTLLQNAVRSLATNIDL
ncbi:transient receptor potential cation channel subfamily M member-like 2 isoform X2 [Parasteatoda tepidariorum]|uniref:transient receptor potential cation channel subfamily M member-like 2 isoform X2 n=1 Tax=Parasteatoda tepidariorum TaxID=114398 RepID=UPI0039BD5369